MSPLPEPEFSALPIDGAQLVRHRVVQYNSSILVEAKRDGWTGLYEQPVDHLYWIVTHRGVLRDWGRHEYTTDRYSVAYGEVEVALVDGREGSPTEGELALVRLRAGEGEGLLIPPGVWHTFRAITDDAVLVNAKTPSYDAGKVDKAKLPIDGSFGFSWAS